MDLLDFDHYLRNRQPDLRLVASIVKLSFTNVIQPLQKIVPLLLLDALSLALEALASFLDRLL
jgi:hypothetical protein